MKNLFYKELKLTIHPLCYIFAFAFPILVLIPNFPLFAASIYIIPSLGILFLGTNKGKQSNDLFYTALLPVRKKDIVIARMVSTVFLELATLLTMIILTPLKIFIASKISIPADAYSIISTQGAVATFSFTLIADGIVNAIYFLFFYKNGRSINAPTLISVLFFVLFVSIFTIMLPLISTGYRSFFVSPNPGVRAGLIIGSILIFILICCLTIKKATKLLEKVDL